MVIKYSTLKNTKLSKKLTQSHLSGCAQTSTPCEKQGLISLASQIIRMDVAPRRVRKRQRDFTLIAAPRYEKRLSRVAGRSIINLLQNAVRFSLIYRNVIVNFHDVVYWKRFFMRRRLKIFWMYRTFLGMS